MKTILFVLISTMASFALAKPDLAALKGSDVLSGQPVALDKHKGVAVVFLSAVCPCSNSHIGELKDLAAKYPDFQFVGIHSNADEAMATTKPYFQTAALPFHVIQDDKAKIATAFEALKTPHAFLMDASGKILYQGGVTNSHDAPSADRKFLRDALEDVKSGRPVKTSEGRTLGCVISRGA